MSLQETFIENLKYYRRAAGFSQKDLSVLLNKGYNYINSIEGASSFPPPTVIDEIANILKIEVEVLFMRDACPKNLASSFKRKWGETFKTTLVSRVRSEIERTCEELL